MRKEKKGFFTKQNIVALFIVIILVSSAVGLMFGKAGLEKEKYNDYTFIRKGNGWIIRTENVELGFNYFPTEVEHIDLSSDIIDRISGPLEIDSTYDSNDTYAEAIAAAQFGLSDVLSRANIYLRVGLIDENEFNMPIITCENSTVHVPVIYFRESNQTKIYLEEDCIIAEADNEADFIRIKDRLLYGLLDII